MNVLLVGSGGREHALAWKIAQSRGLTRLVAAPGNPGIATLCECRPVGVTDVDALVGLATEIDADLVVVGPEAALAVGLADALAAAGVPCFGPTASAARLETSKAFSKALAEAYGLPTAAHVACDSADDAFAALDGFTPPYVIKADGLAAGKGVVIAQDRAEAEAAISAMLGGRFGGAGARVVIEAFLEGEEASLFALCDGKTAVLFGAAKDYKRAFDGDQGPNTGGMGTYSPAPVATSAAVTAAEKTLILPALRAMTQEGAPFRGVLFAGLMIEKDTPSLVEFNARFGDPECQVLMLRLKSDLLPYLYAAAMGTLADLPPPDWRNEAAVCVVLAARGYPDAPESGSVIRGAEQGFGPEVEVFHAGTARRADGALVAAGGRVLNVCARGETLAQARQRAYAAAAQIDWPGGFYRSDIGGRAVRDP